MLSIHFGPGPIRYTWPDERNCPRKSKYQENVKKVLTPKYQKTLRKFGPNPLTNFLTEKNKCIVKDKKPEFHIKGQK